MIPIERKLVQSSTVALLLLGVVVAIGMPGTPSAPTKVKGPQCISGEYVITKSVVAPRDDKALQIIAAADGNSYRVADQSRTAMLVRDIQEEPDPEYLNDDSPSPIDGHEIVPEEDATLCDSLRRLSRDQRRSNNERAQDGENPEIVRRVACECNYVVTQEQAQVAPTDPKLGSSWQYADQTLKLHAAEAWAITTGSPSTVVAVVDGGIDYKHPDLASNMWVNPEEIPGDLKDNDSNGFVDDVNGASMLGPYTDIMDEGGHGTHVAGIIAAAANNNEGTVGMMWKASLMAVRVFDATGKSSDMTIIKGTDYVTMMKGRGVNIAVANYSLGGPSYSDALFQAFKKQSEAGISAPVAAGNEVSNNDTTPSYPANFQLPGLISVAALENGAYHAEYSNYGKATVHLSAPGSWIFSTYPTQLGSYANLSGTSMASPHVAGVLGLMASRAAALSPAEAASVVTNNGAAISQLTGVTITGRALDAQASLRGVPTHDSSVSGNILTNGTPLKGANLSFVNGAAKFAVSTDANGAFSAKVKAGTYTVTPYKYHVDFSPPSQTVTVAANGTVTLSFTAKDQPFFDIIGKIVPGDGFSPVSNISVSILDKNNNPLKYERTAADGTFRASVLPPGTYTVRADPNSGRSVTPPSQSVTLTDGHVSGVTFTLNQIAPVIVEQPAGLTVNDGDPFTLRVKSGGADLTYQWMRGSSFPAITGATSATYTVQSATPADNDSYYAMVKNSSGTAYSQRAYIKVVPVILTDLKDVTLNEGNDAEFSITARATGMKTQWFVDGQYYYLCTDALVCKIPTKGSASSRRVQVFIQNSANNWAQSRIASLTVRPPLPVISAFDGPASVEEGAQARFSVSAIGAGLTYQWFRNGTAIPGATYPVLNLVSVAYEDSGSTYRVVVTSAGGSVQREATLKVTLLKPFIYEMPLVSTVKVGLPVTLSVKASGQKVTYQWLHKGVALPGATTASYTIPSVSESHAGSYEVTVTNESGVARASTLIAIAAKAPPTISYQPTNTSVYAGQIAQFSTYSYNASTFQWYRDGVAIPGAGGTGFTIPSATLNDSGAKFFVEVSNADGTIRSDTVTLTVTPEPLFFTQSLNGQVIVEESTATLTVGVDDPAAQFTWYRNDVEIPGVSGPVYSFKTAISDDGVRIRVVAHSANRATTESSATVRVQAIAPPKFSYFGGPVKVIAGQWLSLAGSLDDMSAKVRIYKDDVELSNSNSPYYSKIATVADSGTYFARAWKGSKYTDSDKVTVVVEPPTLLVAALPTKLSAKVGQKITLNASADTNLRSAPLQYQWFRNGAPIRSATTNSLKYKVRAADKKATLSVVVSVGDLKVASSRTAIVLKK